MDICRITKSTEKDVERQERYKAESAKLMKSFNNLVHFDIASYDIKLVHHPKKITLLRTIVYRRIWQTKKMFLT